MGKVIYVIFGRSQSLGYEDVFDYRIISYKSCHCVHSLTGIERGQLKNLWAFKFPFCFVDHRV